jgi:hypothetical protein
MALMDQYLIFVRNLGKSSEHITVYERGDREETLCTCDDLANAKLIADALNMWARRQKAMKRLPATVIGALR